MPALRAWYSNLLKSAEGFRQGAGIPTAAEAATTAQLAGMALMGDPAARHATSQLAGQTLQGLGSMVSHPFRTGEALLEHIRQNPAGAAGTALGMAFPMPFGKKFGDYPGLEKIAAESRNPEAMRYGQYILHLAERRMDARVAAERARSVQSAHELAGGSPITPGRPKMGDEAQRAYWAEMERLQAAAQKEGYTGFGTPRGSAAEAHLEHLLQGPPPDLSVQGIGPIESFGDELAMLRNLPDETLQQAYKTALTQWKAAGELGNDYQKGMLREFVRRGIKPDISDELHVLHEGPGRPLNYGQTKPTPEIWTREQRGGEMLQNLNFPKPTPHQGMRLEVAEFLNRARPNDPSGTRIHNWMKTDRGWTWVGLD